MLNDDGELFPQKLRASEMHALGEWGICSLLRLQDIDDVKYVLDTLRCHSLFAPGGEEPIHDLQRRCQKIHDYWEEHR